MSAGSRKHFSIRIVGHVQGVFYRASAAEKAKKLNLVGFVRNEEDGSVYVEAEGDEQSLEEFISWTKLGPPRARVHRCEVIEGEMKNFLRFEIQR